MERQILQMECFTKTGFVSRISQHSIFDTLAIECKTTPGNFTVLMPKKMGQMVEEKKLYIFHVKEDNYVVDIEEIMQFKKVFTATIKKTIKTNATQVLIFENSSKKTQVVIADKEFDFNPYLGKKVKIVIDKKFGNIVHFKSISIINDNINSTKTSQQELNVDLMKNSNVSLSMTSTSFYLILNFTFKNFHTIKMKLLLKSILLFRFFYNFN